MARRKKVVNLTQMSEVSSWDVQSISKNPRDAVLTCTLFPVLPSFLPICLPPWKSNEKSQIMKSKMFQIKQKWQFKQTFGCKESDTTERWNWTELNWTEGSPPDYICCMQSFIHVFNKYLLKSYSELSSVLDLWKWNNRKNTIQNLLYQA